MTILSLTVIGKSEPQGSMKAFMPKGAKHPVLTSDNEKLKPWRQQISIMSLIAMKGAKPTPEAIAIEAAFYFARPKSNAKREYKTTKPDLDKLVRALLDSLTGIVFVDDSQVVSIKATKEYDLPERVTFAVLKV